MHHKIVAGVDFGTSSSGIGYANQTCFQLTELEPEKYMIPTAIFFNEKNKALFGNAAMTAYTSYEPGRLMRSLKSILSWGIEDQDTLVNGRMMKLEKIIGLFLKNLKDKAEHQAQTTIEDVVLGRPVHFSDDPKADSYAANALIRIAQNQGFKNVLFQYEPIAAARDYETTLQNETIVFVADIGGGTSDFSVIKLSPNTLNSHNRKEDVLANDSVHIAGTDLDTNIAWGKIMPCLGRDTLQQNGLPMPNHWYSRLSRWEEIADMYDRKIMHIVQETAQTAQNTEALQRLTKVLDQQLGHQLLMSAEQAKITLGQKTATQIPLDCIENNLNLTLSKEDFNNLIKTNLSKIMDKASETLIQANVKPHQIQNILLTGGSSALPAFQQNIQKIIPAPIVQRDLFSSVTTGLTLDAQKRFL